MKAIRAILACSAAMLACPVHAQEAAVPPAGQPEEGGIQDIIVTAQRRAENVQKSSLSISVVTPDVLAKSGVTSTADLTRVLAGVQIGTSGTVPQIFIRGVGDFGTTAVTNPAVALNVGGVYSARPGAVGGAFFDLERVEVLKGPQGTLYGRNASGGAINILPVRPKLGVTQGVVNLEVGNYAAIMSDGAINLPIGDTVAVRAAYQVANRDGYLSDGSNDDIHQSVRVQAFWEPSEGVSALLFGSYFHAGGVGAGYALYDPAGNPLGQPPRAPTPALDPWTSVTDPRGAAILATGAPPPVFKPGDPNALYQNDDYWNLQAEVNVDLGFATLTVIPSYQHATLDYRIFPAISYHTRGAAGLGSPETSRTISTEARLSNDGDRLKWVVGAFYYNEQQGQQGTIDNGLAQNVSLSADIKTESVAVFGQATYGIAPGLRVIAGLRYTNDRRDLTNGRQFNNNVPGLPPALFAGQAEANKVNYKAGIEYDLAERNMVYATVATGFKGGGTQLAQADPFRPETIQAFELGSRNRFLDNRLQLNVEAFYWKYDDHQEVTIGPDNGGTVSALIRNAGKAKSYGASADAVLRISPDDTLSGTVEYNATNYDEFRFVQPLAFLPPGQIACAIIPTGAIGPIGPTATVDCSGRPLARAPKWTGGASYSHSFRLAGGDTIEFVGDMKFAAARWLSVDFTPNTRAPAYQTVNAAITYTTDEERLSLTGFVRNITDETVYTAASQSSFTPTYVGANINPPRTYGVRLGYRY